MALRAGRGGGPSLSSTNLEVDRTSADLAVPGARVELAIVVEAATTRAASIAAQPAAKDLSDN